METVTPRAGSETVDCFAGLPDGRLGSVLRARRRDADLTAAGAAAGAGIETDDLLDFEAGSRRPDPPTVARLVAQYGVAVDDLFPPRRRLDPATLTGRPEREVLAGYVEQVRAWRGAATGRPMQFRRTDLDVLVGMLGTNPAGIEQRLVTLTGCSRRSARRFRKVLVFSLLASAGGALFGGVALAAQGPDGPPAPASPAPTAAVAVETTPGPPPTVCAPPAPETPVATPAAAPAAAATVQVTFTIASYVDVQVDAAGNPVAVRTNTGNGPRCSDSSWFVVAPGQDEGTPTGDLTIVNRAVDMASSITSLPESGDWKPGQWYSLR